MKKYTTLSIILIFSLFLLTSCARLKKEPTDLEIIYERGYLIAGVKTDSPPFGYYDKNGELTGIDIELTKKIADEIFEEENSKRIYFVPVTPQTKIAKLNSKEIDIIVATLSITPKRKLIMDFSIPYFTANQTIMTKKDSDIKNIYYFNKKGKLGVVLGTTGEKAARMIVPNAYVIGMTNYTEALKNLKNGNINGILGDDAILKGLNKGDYKIIPHSYSKEFYGVGVRKTENSKENRYRNIRSVRRKKV